MYIEDDVEIGDNCIIFPFVSILSGTRMGKNNKVHQGSVIGALPQDFEFCGEKSECIIGDGNIIRENVVINRATHTGGQTVIGNENVLMEGAHISHDTKVGNRCVFGYGTKIAGDCEIEDGAIFSSSVIANAGVRVGRAAMVQAGTTFSKDVPPGIICTKRVEFGGINTTMCKFYGIDDKVAGTTFSKDVPPGIICTKRVEFGGINTTMCKFYGIDDKVIKHMANAYRLVFHGQTSLFDAINQIEEQVPDSAEIRHIIEFMRNTKLGIITKM